MFEKEIAQLNRVQRHDIVTNSNALRFQVGETAEGPRITVGVRDHELALDDGGRESLLRQWSVPVTHFDRLSTDLQRETLEYLARNDSRDLMLRTVREAGGDQSSVRAVLSAKYAPLDNAELLQAIAPYIEGWHVTPMVGRDSMAVYAYLPTTHDVSDRQVGDLIRSGVAITNSECGFGAAEAQVSSLRLVCRNGMVAGDLKKARQIHRGANVDTFLERLRAVIAEAGVAGALLARRMRTAHKFAITSLDEDGDRLQRQIIGILRSAQIWTKGLRDQVNAALGTTEESSLFGVVQALSSADRLASASIDERVARQQAAGRVLALVD